MELRRLGRCPNSSPSSSSSTLPGEGGGVGTLCKSTTIDSGDCVWGLCPTPLLGGLERGGVNVAPFVGPETEFNEEIEVLDPGDLVKVEDGAEEGAVEVDDDGVDTDNSEELWTEETDDEEPDGVGR